MVELRTLIVDDEPLARHRLRRMLRQYPGVEVVGECADGMAALRAAQECNPDLLLLDIQMPGLDGFGVVEGLAPGSLPIIVFVTAYDQHAIHAFEACALDYLLKPVDPDELNAAVQRHLEKQESAQQKKELFDNLVKNIEKKEVRDFKIAVPSSISISSAGSSAKLTVSPSSPLSNSSARSRSSSAACSASSRSKASRSALGI